MELREQADYCISITRTFRCDECGRFVSMKDIESGEAIRQMVTPDSEFTSEEYETVCRACCT